MAYLSQRYQAVLGQAAAAGEPMLQRAMREVRRSLAEEVMHSTNVLLRDQLHLSRKLLESKTATLCAGFPALLRANFQKKRGVDSQFGALTLQELHHNQLGHMHPSQVQERIELTRVLQTSLLVTEADFAELSACMDALLDKTDQKPERNPLRPQVFVMALQELLVQETVPSAVRLIWVKHLSAAFGESLRVLYAAMSQSLLAQGIAPAANGSVASAHGEVPPIRISQKGSKNLTLDRLRALLAGDMAAFSSKPDDRPDTNFACTVPAPLEILKELKMDPLRSAQKSVADVTLQETSAAVIRKKLLDNCTDGNQALRLEVVVLMIENLAQDNRLLEPVRRVIENFEPALLRLALVDARFFSDLEHPARKLLMEITQRGLAFGAVEAPEFKAFLMSLYRFVLPLAKQPIESAEPFQLALGKIQDYWQSGLPENSKTNPIETAVQALQHAEARNLLAEKMVAGMEQLPELQRVPASVAEFLCGPWAQVMAFAELKDGATSDDPGQYKELVTALLWSAQPELTRANVAKLTKLVPRLLSKLRDGLTLIDYPTVKTSAFFDVLMKVHQQAFKQPQSVELVQNRTGLSQSLLGDQAHWVAPTEVKASGFMDWIEEPVHSTETTDPKASGTEIVSQMFEPTVGIWVELLVKGLWQRTQLTWISPQRTMYLFTSGYGQTQSMSRRSLDKMLASGHLRVLSEQSMVDTALDAVVQKAILNSLDIRL